MHPQDRAPAQSSSDNVTLARPASPQPVVCPYCHRPLTTRADLSFTCARCGDFPNYGRMFTTTQR
jgi:hypothetical protein